ncbi:MAG: threonine--tRNA ligase [Candidatus Cloacimonetes bacterium]|nr:threonine--tRNA ligase [Candidatus Cloacimonadota bacterium]
MADKIVIRFPDGAEKEFETGVSPLQIAEGINPQFAIRQLVAEVNGKLVDMNYHINQNSEIMFHSFNSEQGKEVYWHSSAHLMAQAVRQLFPEVKVTIGPSIENGFYYDFDREQSFTDEELLAIEERMHKLAKEKLPFLRQELSKKEAMAMFKKMNEPYKIELLEDIDDNEVISIYTLGDFVDLCRGPHLEHTGKIKAIKLLKTSGAYWRGDVSKKMLKRIYGITYPNKKDMKKYLLFLEEARKRDHRKLGKELDLFSFSDDIGQGLCLWHPNGAMVRSIIEDYWKKKHYAADYKIVYTPHIGKAELWQTSGHLDFYSESMYSAIEVDGSDFYLKPMNCPFHIEIYKSTKRSYRELPLKYSELGTVYRYEPSGALNGLKRVRGFTQDDAHIICTEEQLLEEVEKLLDFSMSMLQDFGFEEFRVKLATMPDKSVGDAKDWDKAIKSLQNALEKNNIKFEVDEGGGAFYGPKIDIHIKDSLNRLWQLTTIQFDFNLAERFKMEYIGADNQAHRPFMIHRALLGSIERFFGILIEHYAGNFPVWLAPVQVMVIPLSENYNHYAERKYTKLREQGIRVECDFRNEKVGYKIREAEMSKIPFMYIVGAREEDTNTIAVRRHGSGDLGTFTFDEALKVIRGEIQERT